MLLLLLAFLAASESLAAARGTTPPLPWTRTTARDYLSTNRTHDGVVETKSGLQYRIFTEGTGCRPKPGSKVHLHYTVHVAGDDVLVDDSRAHGGAQALWLREMIPAWKEGVPLMREGALWEFTAPPALAYGDAGLPPKVPPHAVLVFAVELVKAEACKAEKAPAPGP
jgi:FKBP-type peptidyl-prolyl cis-trans isomerase